MKKPNLVFAFALFLSAISLTSFLSPKNLILETKTFGVCTCADGASAGQMVSLTLNPDNTFHYLNASDPAKKLDIRGQWKPEGQKVILTADDGRTGFHSTWKFDKDQSCVVSRKGLQFIRLCDLRACK